jgi:2-polyprenyl-3-methyl-5-hydroxy-6-metoxy-1,4-benzoquinol methylase
MSQHDQALSFFDQSAGAWQQKSIGALKAYPLVEMRHRAVLHVLSQIKARDFLDVGCGTGQLAIEVAQKGLISTGIDFAPEMIRHCEENEAKAKSGANFQCIAALEYKTADQSLDLISAQGFIEYLSLEDCERFFEMCGKWLRPGGHFVVGSRNRLFNAITMNGYTNLEQSIGMLDALVTEATVIEQSASQTEMLANLDGVGDGMEHPKQHPKTGIGVETRYQFTPAELVEKLRRRGFKAKAIYPVHYHGLPVGLVEPNIDLHIRIAAAVENIGYPNHKLIPFASTFIVHAERT